MSVRPAKTQINLSIRPVWSVFAVREKKAWALSYPLSAQRRLRSAGCPGWSEFSLGAQSFCWYCHEVALISYVKPKWHFVLYVTLIIIIIRIHLQSMSAYIRYALHTGLPYLNWMKSFTFMIGWNRSNLWLFCIDLPHVVVSIAGPYRPRPFPPQMKWSTLVKIIFGTVLIFLAMTRDIFIIRTLFQEDNIFGTNASLTYCPQIQTYMRLIITDRS